MTSQARISALIGLLCGSLVSLAAKDFAIPFKQYKLENGLTVILSEDHAAPTVAVVVCYRVGSGDERPGRTGFAHFFEHMMFSGTESAPDIGAVMRAAGGDVSMGNMTMRDRTYYAEIMPANQLDVALFLEADRMVSLKFTSEQVEHMRADVKEERRLRVDNRAYGKSAEVISNTAYSALPYDHMVLGSMKDLDAASMEDVQAFYKQYYAPNNATLVIVGAFNSEEALRKARKYFGGIPAQPPPPRPDFSPPAQAVERRLTIEDAFAQTPQIDVAYRIPPGTAPDYYPIEALTSILGDSDSSRLPQQLVEDKSLAVVAYAWTERNRGPGLVRIHLDPRPGTNLELLEKAAYDVIAKLQREPVANWELEKVRIAARRASVRNAEAYIWRAHQLFESAVVFGDAHLVNAESQSLAKVTQADLIRVARKYLTDSNRTVVITLPKVK